MFREFMDPLFIEALILEKHIYDIHEIIIRGEMFSS